MRHCLTNIVRLSSSKILPQLLEKDACVALQETAFTSFRGHATTTPSSPDATDKAFNWNDQRVLLAPSLSDAGSKVESPESGHPTMLSKNDQFMYSKENAKVSELRNHSLKALSLDSSRANIGNIWILQCTVRKQTLHPISSHIYTPVTRSKFHRPRSRKCKPRDTW